jgi:hypothetical protein
MVQLVGRKTPQWSGAGRDRSPQVPAPTGSARRRSPGLEGRQLREQSVVGDEFIRLSIDSDSYPQDCESSAFASGITTYELH